jgi:hypothetical protein
MNKMSRALALTCIMTGSLTKKDSMYMSNMLLVVARLSSRHSAWNGPSVSPSISKAMAMTMAPITKVYLKTVTSVYNAGNK